MERRIEQMTAREIREGLKKGLGMRHFCDRYGCSEDEIVIRIGQLYNRGSGEEKDKVISSLRKNDKKLASKKAGGRSKKGPIQATQATETEEPNTSATPSLEEVEREEKDLSDRLMELESMQKKHFAEKHVNVDEMTKIKAKIESMKAELNEMRCQFEACIAKDVALTEQINKTSDEYSEKKARIQEIREIKKELNRVIIYVYDDGSIVSESSEVLNDSGSDLLCLELISEDACDGLQVKEVKILARILKVTENISSEKDVEILFDNEEIEKAFLILRR